MNTKPELLQRSWVNKLVLIIWRKKERWKNAWICCNLQLVKMRVPSFKSPRNYSPSFILKLKSVCQLIYNLRSENIWSASIKMETPILRRKPGLYISASLCFRSKFISINLLFEFVSLTWQRGQTKCEAWQKQNAREDQGRTEERERGKRARCDVRVNWWSTAIINQAKIARLTHETANTRKIQ